MIQIVFNWLPGMEVHWSFKGKWLPCECRLCLRENKPLVDSCCHRTVTLLSPSRLLQPCPSSSPCCWPASTAAVTPGSICASPGTCSRILGRTFCAVRLTTSSPPSAAVSVTLTPATRATPPPLSSRAQAARGASHRLPLHEHAPSHPFNKLPALPFTTRRQP